MPATIHFARLRPVLAAGLLCAAAHLPAAAQPAVPGTPAPLPAMKSSGKAQYACGGIGIDESTAFRAAMKQHPLSLLFAAAGGDYQANVQVDIRDAQGAGVLSVSADGPVCLVDLPKGSYTVEARKGERSQKRSIAIDGTPKTADFRF